MTPGRGAPVAGAGEARVTERLTADERNQVLRQRGVLPVVHGTLELPLSDGSRLELRCVVGHERLSVESADGVLGEFVPTAARVAVGDGPALARPLVVLGGPVLLDRVSDDSHDHPYLRCAELGRQVRWSGGRLAGRELRVVDEEDPARALVSAVPAARDRSLGRAARGVADDVHTVSWTDDAHVADVVLLELVLLAALGSEIDHLGSTVAGVIGGVTGIRKAFGKRPDPFPSAD